MRQAMPTGRRGFTLVELLIVISILMLLSAASLSALYAFRANLALNYSAEYAKAAIRRSQMHAIAKQTTVSCRPAGLNKTFVFSRSGFPVVGGSGTGTLKNSTGRTKKIIVSSVGRVRVE